MARRGRQVNLAGVEQDQHAALGEMIDQGLDDRAAWLGAQAEHRTQSKSHQAGVGDRDQVEVPHAVGIGLGWSTLSGRDHRREAALARTSDADDGHQTVGGEDRSATSARSLVRPTNEVTGQGRLCGESPSVRGPRELTLQIGRR